MEIVSTITHRERETEEDADGVSDPVCDGKSFSCFFNNVSPTSFVKVRKSMEQEMELI